MVKGLDILKHAAVSLAAIGILLPPARSLAAEQAVRSKPNVKVVDANSILDVSLGTGGTFKGRVVDHSGNPLEGAKVAIKRGNLDVAQVTTDSRGTFIAGNLSGGVYRISSGNTEGFYRVWADKTAPPSANPQGLLVMGENGVRGQWGVLDRFGGIILVTTALVALSALVLAIHADHEADNAAKFNNAKSP